MKTDPIKKESIAVMGLFRGIIAQTYQHDSLRFFILREFINWAASGSMFSVTIRGLSYYWLDYAVMSDQWLTPVKTLRKVFADLSGESPKNRDTCLRPLLLRESFNTNGKNRTYFAFNPPAIKSIVAWDRLPAPRVQLLEAMMKSVPLIDVSPELKSANTKNLRAHPLHKEVLDLLADILPLHIRGKESKTIFQNQPPEDDLHYTKALADFDTKVKSLFVGRFLAEYPLSPEFSKRNKYYITPDTLKAIKACKGSWTAIKALIKQAAKYYRMWFWEEKEPEQKAWLPRDISNWVYNPRNQTSLMMAAALYPPEAMREAATDRVYDSIDSGLRSEAEALLNERMDPMAFWRGIRDMEKWFQDRYYRIQECSNLGYWFDGGLVQWFLRYKSWLLNLTGGNLGALYQSQIGPGNKTWAAWVTYSVQYHNIDISLEKDPALN